MPWLVGTDGVFRVRRSGDEVRARLSVMDERVAHAKRVEYLAYHDSLTELPNRAFFSGLLAQRIQQARRYERRLAPIALGKSLSLTVIAEGVESAAQADFLRSHGCDEFQGFVIDKPMPAEEFARQLRASMLTTSSG